MYSSTLILGLLAGGVLSSPAPHGAHKHSPRQRIVDVVDVVDVYTTVTAGFSAPSPHSDKVEEKMAVHQGGFPQGGFPQDGQQGQQQHQPPPSQPQQPPAQPPPPPPQSSAPPPQTTGGASGSGGGQSSGNPYLDMHNKFRGDHGAVPMSWDSALASKAASQAGSCPSNDVQSGSNWYGSSGSSTDPSPAVQAWYNEMSAYAAASNNYASNPSSGGPDTGHFSQMIWNASTSLGCGLSSSCGGSWVTQVTCLYEPAGNMVFNGQPQYVENVFPPKS